MVTNLIILICIIIFGCINLLEDDKIAGAIKYGALYPPKVELKREYWRIITANFVHIEIFHIVMNLYGIYYLGSFFEQYLGTVLYLYLVIFCCLSTTGTTYIIALKNRRLENTITLGASGIFYGYLGALIAMGMWFQGQYIRLVSAYLGVIMMNIVFTLLNPRISKTGHFGGLIGGFIAISILVMAGM
jgi:rhomboid protease GluP